MLKKLFLLIIIIALVYILTDDELFQKIENAVRKKTNKIESNGVDLTDVVEQQKDSKNWDSGGVGTQQLEDNVTGMRVG
jgi:hypothetical protein